MMGLKRWLQPHVICHRDVYLLPYNMDLAEQLYPIRERIKALEVGACLIKISMDGSATILIDQRYVQLKALSNLTWLI